MNSLQPSSSPSRPRSGRLAGRQPRPRRRRRQSHHAVAAEGMAMIGVNLLLAIAAFTALVKLLPAKVTQQAELQELQGEVQALEQRVNGLRDEFEPLFDAHQTQSNMRGLSNRIPPGEQRIILVDPAESDVD